MDEKSVLTDMIDMKIERTKTIISGGDCCDFRYRKRNETNITKQKWQTDF